MRALPLSIVLAIGVAGARPAAAQSSVRFEARVSSEAVSMDQTIELTITIDRDGQQAFDAYRPPSMADFDLLHTGTSEQMQWNVVGGKQHVRIAEQHTYVLRAKKKGALTIGPATVKVAGEEFRTRAIPIQVTAGLTRPGVSPTAQPTTAPLNAPPVSPPALRGDEDVFVDARADKTKVYVGEQVTASWRLYTQSEILKYRSVTDPKHDDFWSEDLFLPQGHLAWDRQTIKGREFAVALLLRKALFPLKSGKLTVTPLDAEATTLQTAFYDAGSSVRRSKPLLLEVLPLPVAGRPEGFESSNVGKLALDGQADRTAVKAGEAVSFTLTVRGTGNVRNFKVPRPRFEGFKVYEPTARETLERPDGDLVRGQKSYTYLLMPQKGGALSIPTVELPYFDPQIGKYDVARTKAIAITVEGDPSKLEASAVSLTPENVLAPQIRPIRSTGVVRSRVGVRLWRGRLALALLLAPPGAWILALIGDALRRRLARETPRSKRRRARRTARRRLRVAEYNIKAGRPSAFFGECARAIYEHLEYRLGGKVEALTLGELRIHLEQWGMSKETTEGVVKELENCDFARFAPSASGPGEMRAALRRVRTLLGWIEKAKINPPAGKEKAA